MKKVKAKHSEQWQVRMIDGHRIVTDFDIDIEPLESLDGVSHVQIFDSFPQLIRKFRPKFQGWYTESAEGGLAVYPQERENPDRIIGIVKKMSELSPAKG